MNRIKFYFDKYKFYIIVYLFLIFIFIVIFNNKSYKEIESVDAIKSNVEEEVITEVSIDIKGLVVNPGVYNIKSDSRIIDAIKLAGGLKEGANTEQINLSKKVYDEMVIVICSNEEVESMKKSNSCNNIDNANYVDEYKTNDISDDKISINTSTLEELMTLEGIGKSKAEAIIKYRNTVGLFNSIEEIMNVSGIGEAIYKKIKDNIKL